MFTDKTGFPSADAIRFSIMNNLLTKAQASKAISVMIAQPLKPKSTTIVTPEATAATEVAKSTPTPEFGYYTKTGADGSEVTFSWNKHTVGSLTKTKLMKLHVYSAFDAQGNKVAKGKWIYYGGTYQAKKILDGLSKLTVEQAGKLGKKYGICIKCGKTLTDPVSVDQGIGPVCIKTGIWG